MRKVSHAAAWPCADRQADPQVACPYTGRAHGQPRTHRPAQWTIHDQRGITMVIWGAIWGAVLGLLWPGYGWEWQSVTGLVLGALAGRMLRGAVRREMQQLRMAP